MSSAVPSSPVGNRLRRPSWLDLRIVLGVLLVLMSVVLVTRIVVTADRSVRVWALTRDVSAGTTLTSADVRPARVRLFDSAPAYLKVDRSPAGRAVSRPLRSGELLPAAALLVRPTGVLVSLPVKLENAPAVGRGELIDVWSTTKGCAPVRVLSGVPVQEVRANGGGALSVSTGALQVVVRIPADRAERVMTALGADTTIRLVLLDGPATVGRADGLIADCTARGPGGSAVPGGFRSTASSKLEAASSKLGAASPRRGAPSPGLSTASPAHSITPGDGAGSSTRPHDTRMQDTRMQDTRMQDTRMQDTRMQDTRVQDTPPQDGSR